MPTPQPAAGGAKTYDELTSLFYSEVFFRCKALCADEDIAKGVTKKTFQLAKSEFNNSHNNDMRFLEGILNRLIEHSHAD